MTPAEISNHPLFEPWTDPVSGVVSHLLRERVAPVQQSFYFTSPGMSSDGMRLWFHAAHPPAPGRSLGLVDFGTGQVTVFPQSHSPGESPMVEAGGDSALFCARNTVWRVRATGDTEPVFTLPSAYIANRELRRLATHLTQSADGRSLLLDGEVGNHWFVAIAEPATGTFRVVKEFAHHFNHAQFSPIDPRLFTIAMDHFHDRVTGRRFHYDLRVWLMDTDDTRFECLTPATYCKHLTGISHEWWSRDGRVCWVDYTGGAFEHDLSTGETACVWPGPLCHAHCNADRTLWCADESPYKWADQPCQVLFLERATGRVVPIVSGMPAPQVDRGWYHIDPHPQFSPDGRWICYTTTVRGRVDVALCAVDQLTT
jgi:hypothetical protein